MHSTRYGRQREVVLIAMIMYFCGQRQLSYLPRSPDILPKTGQNNLPNCALIKVLKNQRVGTRRKYRYRGLAAWLDKRVTTTERFPAFAEHGKTGRIQNYGAKASAAPQRS